MYKKRSQNMSKLPRFQAMAAQDPQIPSGLWYSSGINLVISKQHCLSLLRVQSASLQLEPLPIHRSSCPFSISVDFDLKDQSGSISPTTSAAISAVPSSACCPAANTNTPQHRRRPFWSVMQVFRSQELYITK